MKESRINYHKKISYLACPYSHPDPNVKAKRHQLVNRITFEFHKLGKLVYSPLTHNIPLIHLSEKENNWNDWELFDKSMLARCDELIVLKIDGWKLSKGVTAEIAFAKEINLPILMIDPNKLNLGEIVELKST